MTALPPGGDPRFGPAAPTPPPAPPAGPVASGFGAVPVQPAQAPAQPQAGGFMAAPVPTAAARATSTAARPKLGPPRWLVPSIVGGLVLILAACVGFYVHAEQNSKAKRAVFDHTALAIPETAVGLAHGVGPGVQNAETQVNLAMAANIVTDTVSGGYTDAEGSSVAFVSAGKRVTRPAELDSTAESAKDKFVSGVVGSGTQTPITLTDEPAGKLGGVMKCGAATVEEIPATFCVAVDQGSLVEVIVDGNDVATNAKTALALREAVVTRTS